MHPDGVYPDSMQPENAVVAAGLTGVLHTRQEHVAWAGKPPAASPVKMRD